MAPVWSITHPSHNPPKNSISLLASESLRTDAIHGHFTGGTALIARHTPSALTHLPPVSHVLQHQVGAEREEGGVLGYDAVLRRPTRDLGSPQGKSADLRTCGAGCALRSFFFGFWLLCNWEAPGGTLLKTFSNVTTLSRGTNEQMSKSMNIAYTVDLLVLVLCHIVKALSTVRRTRTFTLYMRYEYRYVRVLVHIEYL